MELESKKKLEIAQANKEKEVIERQITEENEEVSKISSDAKDMTSKITHKGV